MNRNRLHRASVLTLAAALIAAAGAIGAGCGDSDEKNDYVEQINELQLAYADDVTELVSGAPPTTADASAEVASDLAEMTQDLADDIATVEPPEEVTDLHGRLVATLEGVSTQITDAEETIANGTPQQAQQAASELQTATAAAQSELRSLIDQINSELQG